MKTKDIAIQSAPSAMPPYAGGKAKVIIAGGGTGGHIFPAVAIANAIKKLAPKTEILFVGAKGKMEMEKVPEAGYEIRGLDIAGFNRSSLIKNIGLPLKLVKSFFQVRSIFKSFKPDAVVGVGGYSSFPVLRYAQLKKIPTFIHESNSFAGKSNILLGKKASAVFVAASGMQAFFPAQKITVSGNPVRPGIAGVASVSKAAARAFFNLQPQNKTVLVVGGSLGAKSINQAVAAGLEALTAAGLQIIWQTGKNNAAEWQAKAKALPGVWVNSFIAQMDMAYAAADMVVSRAGAMAVAELCVAQKPVIFVPFPYAAEDHQTANAKNLVHKNAALLVSDADAATMLVPALLELAGNEEQQNKLKENIGKYAVVNADEKIAGEILDHIFKHQNAH